MHVTSYRPTYSVSLKGEFEYQINLLFIHLLLPKPSPLQYFYLFMD